MSEVRFLKFKVVNDKLGTSAKVWYSLDNRGDGRKCVQIYAKDYGSKLTKVFADDIVENRTDTMTDYFEKDTVRLFEDHPLYKQAREAVERFNKERDAKYEAKRAPKTVTPEVTDADLEVAEVYINLMKRMGCKQITI